MSIRLIFLWHMHQPFYKDLVTGEYRLPWVRLHALKDYYGMVKLLDEFPNVHQTFNIVPSLMRQIEDYCSGAARDPFLDVAAKPAADLTPEEVCFALQYLFQANPTHMIGRYPRYRELWEVFRGFAYEPARVQPHFAPQDITDLQVLSQIAWFDEFFLQEPEIAELVRKERNFSLDDQRFVIQQQQHLLAEVLPAYKRAAERGGIEISASPFYHPILPLLCDTDIGAVSSPGLPLPSKRFQHPEDAREQLLRGLDLHQQVFGMRPRGVWPSEGSVSEAVLQIGHQLGVQWMASDEGVLGRTLNTFFQRGGGDRLSAGSAQMLYNIYRYESHDTEMNLIFRDHALSDLLGFVYSGMPATAAVQHLMQHIKESAYAAGETGQDAIVPIILDGENAWEHYPESGRDFLRRLYDAIARDPEMEATTVSEAIARHRSFGKLDHLSPGSWINANLNVWIGAPEDNRSWEHLADARNFFDEAAPNAEPAAREMAFEELLIAEGSDWNWWYGPEHHSANDREFDELYRKHLSNVYQTLGGTAPEALAQPIASMGARSSFVAQTAYIHPRLHEQIAHYFDWVGAAMYTADRTTSAMHGKRFFLDSMLAGIDESSLYVQLGFTGGTPPPPDETYAGFQVVLTCESIAHGSEPQSGDTTRISVEVQNGQVGHWDVTHARDGQGGCGDQELGPANVTQSADAETHTPGDSADSPQVRFRLGDALEMQLPLALLHAQIGGTLRLCVTMWRARLPIDALPLEGSIELRLVSEEELSATGY